MPFMRRSIEPIGPSRGSESDYCLTLIKNYEANYNFTGLKKNTKDGKIGMLDNATCNKILIEKILFTSFYVALV